MGFMDKVRSQATTLAEKAQGGLQTGKEKLDVLPGPPSGQAGAEPILDGPARELQLRYMNARERVVVKGEEIYQHLRALGEPVTKMYPGLLPLFPVVYRLEVRFEPSALPPGAATSVEHRGLQGGAAQIERGREADLWHRQKRGL